VVSRPRLLSQQPLNVQRATPQWARIGSVAGAASDTTYTDAAGITWRYVQWTASNASGLVLATFGILDVLVVGSGGGGISVGANGGAGGGAGAVRYGLFQVPVGAHPITVAPASAAWH